MNLLPHHLADLRRSGLTDATIQAAGIHSESQYDTLRAITGHKRFPKVADSTLVFPCHTTPTQQKEPPVGEAVALNWQDGLFVLDTTGKHPAFHIEAEAQKSRRSEVIPATPDFCEWILAECPQGERVGKVFPLTNRATGKPFATTEVCRIVSAIGRKARVVVDKVTGKYASAHDLRRSFGTRWARRVRTAELQRLMRHADISTTMGFYVDLDADEMAGDLWTKYGTKAGNTPTVGNTSGNTHRGQPTPAVTTGDLTPNVETGCKIGPAGFEPATKGL